MTTGITRRAGLALGGAALGGALSPARAATKIALGYTATLGFNGAFIAKDRGFFAKHGLDVDLTLIALNSTIPAALMADSLQVGGPTPSVLLQANDGGLDLVVVAGCSGTDPANTRDGVMVRKDSGITQPSDFVGKKVGVPGIGAFLHVLFRQWLMDKGVDVKRVNFVETPFSQSADVLRSGSIDAVITGEPFSTRIVQDGGAVAVPIYATVPAGTPSIVYASTRAWAKANAAAVKAFQAAIADAVAFQEKDPAGARESAGKFIKLPPDVLANMLLPSLQAEVTQPQMAAWITMMSGQGMLQEKPDVAGLIAR